MKEVDVQIDDFESNDSKLLFQLLSQMTSRFDSLEESVNLVIQKIDINSQDNNEKFDSINKCLEIQSDRIEGNTKHISEIPIIKERLIGIEEDNTTVKSAMLAESRNQ